MVAQLASVLASLLSCLKQRPQIERSPQLRVSNDSLISVDSCTFCHVSTENGFNIVYEDETFVVYEDWKPASQHHLLVVPRQHITSVRSLSNSDIDMVQKMEEIGQKILTSRNVPDPMRKLGFHIPPFNSVDHLHLHVQALPYLTRYRALKYPVVIGSNGNIKGLSWFVEVHQAIQILQRGKRVGVFPC